MASAESSITTTSQCTADNCDERVYRNNYCVQHYVQFGDIKLSNNSASINEEKQQPVDTEQQQQVATVKPTSSRFSMFGGGGQKCYICNKTSYPAETIPFEQRPYHVDCFKCLSCNKKLDNAANAMSFNNDVYCRACFNKQGLNRKQAQVQWNGTLRLSTSTNPSNSSESIQSNGSNENVTLTTNTKQVSPKSTQRQQLQQQQPQSSPTSRASVSNRFANLGGGGKPCTVCNKTVYSGEAISYDTKIYHPDCLKCNECNKGVSVSDIGGKYNDNVYCRPCWIKGKYNTKQLDTVNKQVAPVQHQESSNVNAAVNAATTTLPQSNSSGKSTLRAQLGGGGSPCTRCSKTVYSGEAVSYNGRLYHSECVTCGDCNKQLPLPDIAGEYDDKLLCRPCWNKGGYAQKQRDTIRSNRPQTPPSNNDNHNTTANTSTDSNNKSTTSSSTVSNRFAHLGGGGGVPCTVCSKTVYTGEALSYEGRVYHPDCLRCTDCNKQVSVSDIGGQYNNHTYCRPCWSKGSYAQKQRDTLGNKSSNNTLNSNKTTTSTKFSNLGGGGVGQCNKCSGTVYGGEAQSYESKVYHPQCLSCSDCSKQCDISDLGGTFDNKLICKICWNTGQYNTKQLNTTSQHNTLQPNNTQKKSLVNSKFATLGGGGLKCAACGKTSYPAESISFNNTLYHNTCFRCCNCSRNIEQVGQAEGKQNKVYCNKCFQDLGLWRADA